MEHFRYDWCGQELEAIRFELYRLNHLKDYTPSMQFFGNEINAISQIQEELRQLAPLTNSIREKVYWLAAQLEWNRIYTTYGDSLLCVSALAAAVCRVMEGKRSSWMAAWTIYGD